MILSIVMLYVLKIIDAPIWCFVVVWMNFGFNALGLILKRIARRKNYDNTGNLRR